MACDEVAFLGGDFIVLGIKMIILIQCSIKGRVYC